MKKSIYQTGDDFVRLNVDFKSDRRIVFLTGLGLSIRNQGEPFIRRFSLLNHVSFTVLDFDNITSNKTERDQFGLATAFDRALDYISKLHEERLLLVGPCFGGLMAYHAASEFPKRTEAVVTSSPLIDFDNGSLSQHIDNFLSLRTERLRKRGVASESLQKMENFRQKLVLATDKYGRLSTHSSYAGPLSILHGEKDRLVPIQNSHQIVQKLNRDNVTFQMVPGGGHTFDMDQDRRMKYTLTAIKKQMGRSI